MRFSTLEQLGINENSLPVRYYNFIQKYENYISKYCNKPISKKTKDELGQIGMELYGVFSKMMEEEYSPWRTLPKGAEIICLKEIFETNPKEIIKYCRVEDLLNDDFFISAQEELTSYYNKNNIEKNEDEIIDEVFDFKFDRKFKRKVFSKGTLELYKLCKEIKPIAQELYEEYKVLCYNQYNQNELEKDITDDL